MNDHSNHSDHRISRRSRIFRSAAVVAVIACVLTAAASPAGAATPDGAVVGCQSQTWQERYLTGITQPSRLWVNLPTSTVANATTYVRYYYGDLAQTYVSGWYRSTAGQAIANQYGRPIASGTREWYNQAGQKMYGLSDTLSHIRPNSIVAVTQEKVVLQNGRFSASRYDTVGVVAC